MNLKKIFLVTSMLLGVALRAHGGPIPPGPTGSFISNSAAPQTAQFNVSSGTVRGPLTVGHLRLSTFTVTGDLTAGVYYGLGTGLTGIPLTGLAAGLLPDIVVASSVAASGVVAGIYGGPDQYVQISVRSDGRIASAVQGQITPEFARLNVNQTFTGVNTFTQPIVGSVTGHAAATLARAEAVAVSTGVLTQGLAAEIARATARENSVAVSTGIINADLQAYKTTVQLSTASIYQALQSTASALTAETARAIARENAIAVSTGVIAANLAGEVLRATAREDAIAVSTGVLTVGLAAEISRATIRENAIGVSTGNIQVQLNSVAVSTGVIAGRVTAAEAALSTAAYVNKANNFTAADNNFVSITASTGTFTGSSFSVGGSTLVVANGRVGVGVSPTKPLHVLADSAGGIYLRSPDNTYPTNTYPSITMRQQGNEAYGWEFVQDDNVNGFLHLHRINADVSTQVMSFDRSATKVGINTTTPGATLHTNGDAHFTGPITIASSGTFTGALLSYGNVTNGYGAVIANIANTSTAHGLYITNAYNTADTFVMRVQSNNTTPLTPNLTDLFAIKGNGNVGIGTTGPGAKLHVVPGEATFSAAASAAAGDGWHYNGSRGIYLTNYSGNTLSSGTIVMASPSYTYSLAFTTSAAQTEAPIGTLMDDSCTANSVCRICTEGICPVKLDSNEACAITDMVVVTGDEVGRADCLPDTTARHNGEVGQPLSFTTSATGSVIWIQAHRN